jgi:vitamin B12 transporter
MLVTAPSAFAQSAPTEAAGGAVAVSPIVVTATRLEMPKLSVASSITLITAEDIAAKQEQTLPDVLADSPGLNVVQEGGPGGQTSVFMRGTNSNHVKVLVDGIDVSDPSSPTDAFDFGQFLAADIASVEILRGPQSGLYGSDAIGGVITVTTKSGEGPAQVTAGAEAGSFATFNQNAGVSGSSGPFHYAADIEHFHSGATPVTPLDLLAPGEARNDDAYDNLTASAKLGYDVTGDFDLGLVARYANTHLRFTGDDDVFYGYPDPIQSQTNTIQYYTRVTGHLSLFDGGFDQTLGLAYGNINSTDVTPEAPDSYYFGDRVKVDWRGDIDLAVGETLILGAEYQQDAITQPISASTTIASGYAELASNPFENFNDTLSVRYDANSRFGNATTWRVAPTYFIAATGTKLEGSVGTGFKAPTLSEMFQNYPAYGFYGNPDLEPERSTGYDAGFEQFLLADRLQFGATYYYNRITNLIDANATFTSYANIGRAHTDGAESFISYRPISVLALRLDYTYTEAYGDILHQELLRRPKNKWNFDARWQASRKLLLDATLVSIGDFIDGNREFTIPRLVAPGYATVNVAANYALTRQLTLYGRITNLFDEHYQDPVGYLRPGLGAFVGVKANL